MRLPPPRPTTRRQAKKAKKAGAVAETAAVEKLPAEQTAAESWNRSWLPKSMRWPQKDTDNAAAVAETAAVENTAAELTAAESWNISWLPKDARRPQKGTDKWGFVRRALPFELKLRFALKNMRMVRGPPPERATRDRNGVTPPREGVAPAGDERVGRDPTIDVANEYRSHVMKSLFLDRKLADVLVVCKDGEVRAHSCMLSLAPVFERMLESPMKEGASRRVELPDMSVTLITSFLELLYTCECSNNQLWGDLLVLADKYEATKLFTVIFAMIEKTVNVHTVVDYIRALNKVMHVEQAQICRAALLQCSAQDLSLSAAIADAL